MTIQNEQHQEQIVEQDFERKCQLEVHELQMPCNSPFILNHQMSPRQFL